MLCLDCNTHTTKGSYDDNALRIIRQRAPSWMTHLSSRPESDSNWSREDLVGLHLGEVATVRSCHSHLQGLVMEGRCEITLRKVLKVSRRVCATTPTATPDAGHGTQKVSQGLCLVLPSSSVLPPRRGDDLFHEGRVQLPQLSEAVHDICQLIWTQPFKVIPDVKV